MSDPLKQLCPDCGRNALACEVLLAQRMGLSGGDVYARLECSQATVERLRVELAAAEKRSQRCTPMRCRTGLDYHRCEAAGHLR